MKRTDLKAIYKDPASFADKTVNICGWVRTLRDSKTIGFISLNDGSTFESVQIVIGKDGIANFDEVVKLNVGAALRVKGKLVLTPDAKQAFEVQGEKIVIEGKSSPDYPLQKKEAQPRIFA